jgi:adenylate cyclase
MRRQAGTVRLDRCVGKERDRRGNGAAKRMSFGASAGSEEAGQTEPSSAGRARIRIAVSSFAASRSEPSENLAFALGQEFTAALGRWRQVDAIAAPSPASARPAWAVREHQFRRLRPDYLVDLTVLDNGPQTEIELRLLDLRADTQAIWSTRLDLSNCGRSRIDALVATDIVGRIDPPVSLGNADSSPRGPHATTGFLRRAIPLMSGMERDKFRQAGQLIKLALQINPDDEEAAAWAARWQYFNITLGYGAHSRQEFTKVRDLALRAMKLNPDNAAAIGMYAHYCAFLEKEFDTALHYFDRSLRINPSLAFVWGLSGPTYCYIGEARTALQRLDHYRDLAPFDPHMSCFELLYAVAYVFNEDYERAAMVGRRGVETFPGFVNGYKPLIAALGHLGRREEAKPYLNKLLRLEPGFTVETFGEVYPIKKAGDRRRYMDGLRLAGVPER